MEDNTMKSIFLASAAFCAALSISACATNHTTGNTAHMDVTATPSGMDCTQGSPELQVYGTPHAATYYKVRLEDASDPSADHGEAKVSVNPAGIIPAGSITDGYKAPCPGTGGHSYRYDVTAVDNLGKVLGTGSYVVTM
jgi:hypothetical protein